MNPIKVVKDSAPDPKVKVVQSDKGNAMASKAVKVSEEAKKAAGDRVKEVLIKKEKGKPKKVEVKKEKKKDRLHLK